MTNDRRGPGWKQLREFPTVRRPDGSGRLTFQAQIICVGCGRTFHHLKRGMIESADYFKRKGWEVGNNADHDRCPDCADAKGKVVKMADHKKPEPVAEEAQQRTLTREDGRLLSRAIEDHWDDAHKVYRTGWSDVKLATSMGAPVDWVKAIRERDFGGTGEDPGLMAFLAEQVSIRMDLRDLHGQLEASTLLHNGLLEELADLGRKIEAYRKSHGRLFDKVTRLDEQAQKLDLPTSSVGVEINKAG
jgi:hypothetical protein